LIAGTVFTFFYVRNKAYSFWQLADLLALSLPLGQALGRFGNFVNQEAFGKPTDLPWKMFISEPNRPVQHFDAKYFHPTFLYEAIANILIFFILWRLRRKTSPGRLNLAYLFLYSFFRFFIEGIRLDSIIILGLRVDQVVALLICLVSGFLFWRWRAVKTLTKH
jgi:phosphatidylglycerol:prolipoprotein diacylglycerol transferase